MRFGGDTIDRGVVLLVGDESETWALARVLTAAGAEVRWAANGTAALAAAAFHTPELILVDADASGIDCFEVCGRLQDCQKTAGIPVILIGAANDPDRRAQGLALGAADFICKPFHDGELLAKVGIHLDLARRRGGLERQLAGSGGPLIWMADAGQSYIFFNRAWADFRGRSPEHELGNGWMDGVHRDDLHRCLAAHAAAWEARRPFQTEYRLRRADGQHRAILENASPRFAPGGDFDGFTGYCVDITRFKREQTQNMSVLVGGIAHDFRNLMTTILAAADVADSELTDGNPPHDELHNIRSAATRALDIVGELTIYAGHDEGTFRPIDLCQLVAETLCVFKSSLSPRATITTELPEHLPPVWGNPTHIQQVAMNLIINASEALADIAGTIRIGVSRFTCADKHVNGLPGLPAGEYIRLEVSDTGRGMTEKERAKIFQPFFSTKRVGRGLGLAVVQRIMQSHGGMVDAKSSPGRGTTFEVLLPCAGQLASLPDLPAPTSSRSAP